MRPVRRRPGGTAMAEQLIGTVTHYFAKPKVAAIQITTGELKVGDTIHIVGHTSDFTQTVGSMQIEHDAVETAQAGQQVGVQVAEHAREHDKVYRVLPD
jgi:translation elongation factor EF-1alpha